MDTTQPPARLAEIDTWIFDLDNTLYPGTCKLYREVEQRMGAFIQEELQLDFEAAHALRRRFLERYGTTLKGLMIEYGMPPARFLDYVHEIDLSAVVEDQALGAAIAGLPGRKLIFTNGTKRHAERVLARLGFDRHFAAIHDIVACDYIPKPEPAAYEAFVRRHAIAPHRAAMIEDMARNLPPAAALGMVTIWIKDGPHPEDGHGAQIDYRIEHAALAPFLAALAAPATRAAE